ncbi:MAG: CDC27 family protein [Planctomycetes bacterium]|nr:CDC27 family protein [Planctomycetota bacterium]
MSVILKSALYIFLLFATAFSCTPVEQNPDDTPVSNENATATPTPTPVQTQIRRPEPANNNPVKPADNPQANTGPVQPENTNPPADIKPESATIDDLIKTLERRLIDFPRSESTRKELAVLYWLNKQYEKSKELLESVDLSKENPGYKMLLSSLSNELGDNDEALKALEEIRRDWTSKYPLKLGAPVFCSFISGYDLYTPIEDPVFSPGQGIPVYCTLGNFFCEKQKNGKMPLSLKVEIELTTAGGNPTVIELDETSWDINREYNNFVNDVYIAFTFIIPKRLIPGAYSLKVAVTNTDSKGETKKDEKSAYFQAR